ncbi:MAG: helix-turn-helix domain-containing protein [Oscillospiraceae bacterium]|nr:helix-turn-helix domain-containing protein [Oscillospiraceae bacterium]
MFEEYRDIVTVGELCVMLRICPARAYALLNSGQIKEFRPGRMWQIPKTSVIEYIERQMSSDNNL